MPSRKILIVEDEALIALDLQRRLERAGCTVVAVAERMEEALDAAARYKPDAVLLDIRIKGEHDGIETARRLRALWDLPVIYVTAHGDSETLERSKVIEEAGYIMKPFMNVDFCARIAEVMTRHEERRQAAR